VLSAYYTLYVLLIAIDSGVGAPVGILFGLERVNTLKTSPNAHACLSPSGYDGGELISSLLTNL